jgi:hypothetical protein
VNGPTQGNVPNPTRHFFGSGRVFHDFSPKDQFWVAYSLPAVGDSDDVFYDSARRRIYATGGEGAISVFQQQDADQYNEIAKITTVKGARTGYFSSDLGRLFVAVRKDGSHACSWLCGNGHFR